ncbi:MAG: glucose dehydrogenase [Planctomycetaceae bacterium]|nr:glucose dehydrogenase [Planctomycetaceae bacterium]
MKRTICAFLALALTTSFGFADLKANKLSDAEKRSGWSLLFDGKTTKGWRNYKKDSISDGWVVKDGALTRAEKGAGDIISDKQYKYFELSLEYNISKGGNSGLFFHVSEEYSRAPWSGPEIQIQDNVDGHDKQLSGWLYQLYKPVKPAWAVKFENQVGYKSPDVADATRPFGEWNLIYLRIDKNQCEVCMNGVSYYYFKLGTKDWNDRVAKSKFAKWEGFGKAGKGYIALQDHGNLVSFRNIKIRELPESGKVPDPVDGTLDLKAVEAFPDITWEGYEGVDDEGRVNKIRPLFLTHAGDGTNRIFVGHQSGMIHVFDNDPKVKKAKLFLDIRERVRQWKLDNEEGLLGLAFHPNYKENGEFFISYTLVDKHINILSRFKVSKKDPNKADPKSEEVVMKIQQPFANHNGGPIKFGKDGYLYLAMGDGGGRNEPEQTAQDLTNVMGSMLRIDINNKDEGKNYAIPKDNPFIGRKGAKPEIYAYGFRNPWQISFDRETGDLWVADVGQDLWEEIHVVKKGGNYGWSIREGSYNFNNNPPRNPEKPIDPVWEYDHRIGKSITGGYVYRASRLPELQGAYLYGDFISGKMWALWYDTKSGKVIKNMSIPSKGLPIWAYGEDEAGEVYYMIESVNGKGIFKYERTK